MKLDYKASNIRKAEKELKQKFFSAFDGITSGNIGMEDLWFLFYAGGGTEEQFDQEMSKGLKNVILLIFEGINDAGFLGKKLDVKAIEKAMDEAMSASI
jgi:hypothetical protein